MHAATAERRVKDPKIRQVRSGRRVEVPRNHVRKTAHTARQHRRKGTLGGATDTGPEEARKGIREKPPRGKAAFQEA